MFGWIKEKRERSLKRQRAIAKTKRGIREINHKLETNDTLDRGLRLTYAMMAQQLEDRLEKLEKWGWYVDVL